MEEGEKAPSLLDRLRDGFVFWTLWLVSTAIAATVRFRVVGWENLLKLETDGKGGLIYLWHGVTILPIYYCRNRGYYAIVSLSRDGELQNRLLLSRGFGTFRGSTARGGARALLESVRALREGKIMALTPDGPKGPAGVVQPGMIHLAKLSGSPVLPVGLACRPCKRLHSWDRHLVPMPFARAVLFFGTPLEIARDESDETAAARIKDAIDDADADAWRLLEGRV